MLPNNWAQTSIGNSPVQNIARIAKSCPENISSVVEVSNCFFLLKYVTITTVPTATVATVTITIITNITTVTVTTVNITTVTIN